MISSIKIIAPDVHLRDAVGNHCTYLARDLQSAGVSTSLYAERFSGDMMPVHPIGQLLEEGAGDSLLLVSYSIIDRHLDALLALPNKKVCYFHGVTPPELLREHEPVTAELCERSYAQFPRLAEFDRLICNSELNRAELEKVFDVSNALVIPPVMPSFPVFQRARVQRTAQSSTVRLMVLGRVVPHKAIEDAIRLAGALKSLGQACELQIVGSCGNLVYMDFLKAEVTRLGLEESVEFVGGISDDELATRLDRSDVLVSCSRHEGFGVPILEAMHLGLPCVIRSGTAASEVGQDVVLEFDTPEEGARQVARLVRSPDFRLQLIKSGGLRSAQLLEQASVPSWLAVLGAV